MVAGHGSKNVRQLAWAASLLPRVGADAFVRARVTKCNLQQEVIRHLIPDDLLHHRSQEWSGRHMAAEERVETHSTFSKIIVYATVISGFVAVYLMYKRGES